jgi:dTDP-D-glucose 4,6-dehydratase
MSSGLNLFIYVTDRPGHDRGYAIDASNSNVFWKCDFRRFYCRAGVSTAIERLMLAGETPALHSESPKASCFWYKINQELGWKPAETFETGIRQAVQWYLDNQYWVKNVTSGDYKNWIEKIYEKSL